MTGTSLVNATDLWQDWSDPDATAIEPGVEAPVPVPGSTSALTDAQSQELASIQKMLRANREAYYRDPAIQARFRELLELEAEGAGGNGDDKTPEVVRLQAPSEWAKAGGAPQDWNAYADLVRAVNNVLVPLSPGDASALGRSFERLPEAVRSKALGVLVDPRPVAPTFISGADMAQIRCNPVCAELADEWGEEAQTKFGRVNARMWKVLDRLTDSEADNVVRWMNGLPRSAVKNLIRRLAA